MIFDKIYVWKYPLRIFNADEADEPLQGKSNNTFSKDRIQSFVEFEENISTNANYETFEFKRWVCVWKLKCERHKQVIVIFAGKIIAFLEVTFSHFRRNLISQPWFTISSNLTARQPLPQYLNFIIEIEETFSSLKLLSLLTFSKSNLACYTPFFHFSSFSDCIGWLL